MSESEFFAAREKDFLLHTSLLADFVGGLVKGAIYAAVGAIACAAMAVTFPASLLVGAAVGLAFGFVFGEAVDAVADAIADLFPPSKDAQIITGSPNVHTKGQPSTRAAGSIENEILIGMIEESRQNPPESKAMQIANGIFHKALLVASILTPIGPTLAIPALVKGLSESPKESDNKEPQKSFLDSVADNILSPTVAKAPDCAKPRDGDKITCNKWHFNDGGLFLAEGSKRVLINSQPACRKGDRSTCEAKIEPEQVGGRKVRIGGESVVVRDILSGKNPFMVMLGEIVGALAVGAIQGGPKALLSCLKEAGCHLISEAIITTLVTVTSSGIGEFFSRAFSSGYPINYATGGKLLYGEEELDFVSEGQYPLYWQRMYHSLNEGEGILGRGWMLPFEESLRLADDNEELLIYTDATGRELGLEMPLPGGSAFYTDEGFTLYRSLDNLLLLQKNQQFYLYESHPLKAGHYRLKQEEDTHGNTLNYHYDITGLLLQIDDNQGGIQVALHYDEVMPRVRSVVEITYAGEERRERELVRYDYNVAGQLITVTDADGVVTRRFNYEAQSGLLSEHQSATGLRACYQYQYCEAPVVESEPAGDEQHKTCLPGTSGTKGSHYRVVSHQLYDGDELLESMTLEYDLVRQMVEVTEAGKGTSFRRWGRHYLITDYVDELDNVWSFSWDKNDRLTAIKDADGHDWLFEYDLYGNLETTTDPEGQKTHTKWDEDFALPLIQELADGSTWYYSYNEKGDLITVTDPDYNDTLYGYDGAGNLIYQRDALGNESRYEYNLRGQLTGQVDCSGNRYRLFYDDDGRLSQSLNPLQQSETYRYSEAGRLTGYTLADGSEVRYAYGATGLLSSVTDAAGRETSYDYNVRGQQTRIRQPNGSIRRFDFDNLGRLRALVNEQEERYRFDYDVAGRLVREQRLDGTEQRFVYNRTGGVISRTLVSRTGREIKTDYRWDKVGRMTHKLNEEQRIHYGYEKGKLTLSGISQQAYREAKQQSKAPVYQQVIFTFDNQGRIKQEENHGGCYRYGYDKNGNLTETSYPDGSVLNHLYYGTGHLLQSSFTRNGHKHMLAEYGRDALHREITRSQGILSEQTKFDAVGRITDKLSLAQGTSRYIRTVLNRHYQYDKVSQLVQQRTIFAEGSTQSERRERYYDYDLAGQVTGYVTDTGRERYDYDLAGNLLDGSVAAEHNQVTRSGQYLYRYDDFGRLETRSHLLTGEVQRYHYNADNQLIRVSFKNSRRYSQVTYAYDVLGRRISKTVYPVSEAVAPEVTHFHWQGMQLTGEHRNEADDTPTYYFYEEGSYTPLVKLDCVATENQIYYYHAEQNGMPVMLTDAEGRVSWQQQSQTLWGTITANHNLNTDTPVSQPLRFAGQYFDNETGLHYNTFRYYDPQVGRFTQPDPIGLLGGFNLYQYAPNPLGWVDPLGLICKAPNGYKNGDVDSHGNLSPSTNRASGHKNNIADGFVQSHHPIQDAWAKRNIAHYHRNSAPATLLRSFSGSPHAKISAAQRARRLLVGGWNTTLRQEFNISYREMINAGVPEKQARKALKNAYKYFDGLRDFNINNPFFDL